MPWELVILAAGLAGLILGFLAGLWTYARVTDAFWKRAEEKAAVKVANAVKQAQSARNRHQEAINRLKATYGPNLRPDQEEVINEEVDRILSGDGRFRVRG